MTIGAPFTGNPHASSIRRAYERITGEQVDGAFMAAIMGESRRPLPVRATSLHSRSDGIVAWQNCLEPEGPLAENIEVVASHCGMMVNPSVLFALGDRLAADPRDWRPFQRDGWRSLVFPGSDAAGEQGGVG